MTQLERQTLEKLNNRLDEYIKADLIWKKEFKNKLDPLIKERNDKTIIQQWWKMAFHVLATIIGFLVSVGLLLHYIVAPLLTKRLP